MPRPHAPLTRDRPAGFRRRLAAALLDGVILVVGLFLLLMVLYIIELSPNVAFGLAWLTTAAYYVLGWSRVSEGQTLGKRSLDIEVVRTSGDYISPARAIARYGASYFSALPFGLGYLWALWDWRHQTWHDKIADTLVRRVEWSPQPQPAVPPPPTRHACPRCGESVATAANVCRFCGLELGTGWAD